MACGDRFKHRIVTPINGYTPQNPYGFVALPWDLADWRSLVDTLSLEAARQVDRLKKFETEHATEPGKTNGSAWYPELEQRLELLAQRVDSIPSGAGVLFQTGPAIESQIGNAIAAAKEATCILELASDALAEYGANVDLPGAEAPATTPAAKVNGLLVLAAIAGGIYLFHRFGGSEE